MQPLIAPPRVHQLKAYPGSQYNFKQLVLDCGSIAMRLGRYRQKGFFTNRVYRDDVVDIELDGSHYGFRHNWIFVTDLTRPVDERTRITLSMPNDVDHLSAPVLEHILNLAVRVDEMPSRWN